MVFEAKYTKVLENLENECDTALQQTNDRIYAKEYEDEYDQILCYGISFFKKRCMVKKKNWDCVGNNHGWNNVRVFMDNLEVDLFNLKCVN